MEGEPKYQYRGDIDQNLEVKDFDNIKSGWLKFLNVEDLCDIISVARNNLPNTDFMYNDDNLIDPDKMPATTKLLDEIRQYEIAHEKELNGKKLIDSIGTQMHVDDRITKKQIIDMFNALKKYGLPIEITEFDMAMIFNISGLSEEEIEDLRNQKINELFEAIIECNIRGFTIWSKTDKQNFRVALENMIRIANGQEPIETLHGGFYNSDMTDKIKYQDFNYHTHTYRSGHSDYVTDEEMLMAAKDAGIKMLGFTEHAPNLPLDFPDEDHKMMSSEVDGYISSINNLKQKNPDMKILIGYEAEFDPTREAFLGELREKVDYMILGQHYVLKGLDGMVAQEGNPEYPMVYAKMVCKGIESGLFDIVAHPDCFMEFRDSIKDEDKAKFEENCKAASEMICLAAANMGIPIEINLGDALNKPRLADGNFGIPHPLFWEIASKTENLKVIKGNDAHSLSAFDDLGKGQALIANIENMVSDKMIKGSYDPVEARQQNQKLQEAYKSHQAEALPYETHLVSQMVNKILESTPAELDPESMVEVVKSSLEGSKARCEAGEKKKVEKLEKEMSEIRESTILTEEDKKVKLNRKEQARNETNQVLINQKNTIDNSIKNMTPEMISKFKQLKAKQEENIEKTLS